MDYKQTAEKIIELVGGKENIQTHTHCMTRLRLVLKNVALAKEDELKKVPGIQGVVNKAGQYQIVIGPDVEQLYNELAPMIPNATAEKVVEENLDAEKESIWNRVLAFISGSITPTLPVLIGSGMISAILSLAANVFHVDTAGSTYTLLNTLANAAYTYLPVLVAFAAARRLKTNEYVAAFIILALCSPAITGVADLTIFGIPLTTVKYTSNIVPALCSEILSEVNRFDHTSADSCADHVPADSAPAWPDWYMGRYNSGEVLCMDHKLRRYQYGDSQCSASFAGHGWYAYSDHTSDRQRNYNLWFFPAVLQGTCR